MNTKIAIHGVPMDLGQGRRGVNMGPSAIRYAGMFDRLSRLGCEVEDFGDIYVDTRQKANEDRSKNLQEITRVNQELAERISTNIEKGYFPLTIGGDHSISIGSIAGVSTHYENLGLIWYDAHGDLNTDDTSPSGNIHGMPLAVALGLGNQQLTNIQHADRKVQPENIVIIGARSLDEGEKKLIHELGIRVYTMHEIDHSGMSHVIKDAIAYLSSKTDGIHLSLDLDGLDPEEAPGVGTPVVGGMSYRESHLAMEMLAEADIITSADFVEVNPILDEKNRTAQIAVELMGSLFGEKLL
ncbi:arginase [Marinococcus sp. PL1-022]|uniref:arginase n=1 Tax=Marinococcus sp. PL1-022 TaxID=3095363 RepID=UPI0029C34D38|nr:arginase [Marinococcus sp. PL1-022]MDX6154493.1 arginase [Marinococcus sp. PL1-022]